MKILTKLEENVLLMILKLRDDAYIVSIKRGLENYLGNSISFGALYLSLNRLIRDGYLQSEIGESTSTKGGRAKKYYKMTQEGIAKLKEVQQIQRVMWENFDSLADKFMDLK
ncbi:MAG: PadR family transcriptional regulator [bacterium]|nr:PadR family transcriptional regulator [bacterium]